MAMTRSELMRFMQGFPGIEEILIDTGEGLKPLKFAEYDVFAPGEPFVFVLTPDLSEE